MYELLTPQEMAEADRQTIKAGIKDGFSLMLVAGRAVAEVAQGMFARNSPVAVLCGPGNNGGDGYVAAQLLLEAGLEVMCFASAPPQKGSDAMRASLFYKGPVSDLGEFSAVSFGGVIDALFGAGLARDIHGSEAVAIDALNSSDVPVVAVDLPSGISGETGEVLGTAIRARATVTFFERSPAICCSREGRIAGCFTSRISAFPIIYLQPSSPILLKMRPSFGKVPFLCWALKLINIVAATQPCFRVALIRLALRVSRLSPQHALGQGRLRFYLRPMRWRLMLPI